MVLRYFPKWFGIFWIGYGTIYLVLFAFMPNYRESVIPGFAQWLLMYIPVFAVGSLVLGFCNFGRSAAAEYVEMVRKQREAARDRLDSALIRLEDVTTRLENQIERTVARREEN